MTTRLVLCERHANKFPILTDGDVTPLVLNDMEMACRHTFAAKETAADKQVSMVLGNFLDKRITNWVRPSAKHTCICILTFMAFMSKVKSKLLPEDWEIQTRLEVLILKQSPEQSFPNYVTDLQSLASLLIGTASAIDDTRLRHTIEANMLTDLSLKYSHDPTASSIATNKFSDWITTVEAQKKLFAELAGGGKRKAPDDGDCGGKDKGYKSRSLTPGNTNGTAGVSGASTSNGAPTYCGKYPPPLTETERKLLSDNDGCNKCRHFFIGHKSYDCTKEISTMSCCCRVRRATSMYIAI
ncbi:hypothetical protein B0H16DRAFT_1297079 [Mycena metata]|uniref:Uncharacterized protein n=1 Tax=Mycena metata TaxID=1033252 RepID=A0AAD7P0E1_9AGAR|nr:hypothetical protein B0H16DRAFT_1297079 [Mycena metata]